MITIKRYFHVLANPAYSVLLIMIFSIYFMPLQGMFPKQSQTFQLINSKINYFMQIRIGFVINPYQGFSCDYFCSKYLIIGITATTLVFNQLHFPLNASDERRVILHCQYEIRTTLTTPYSKKYTFCT